MKEFRIFLFKMLLFTGIALTMYFAVLMTLTHLKVGGNKLVYRAVQGLVWKGGFTYDRFRLFDAEKKYDVLVFGSSRANRGIDPKQFENAGFTLYNLGTDDQTPVNTKVLVKEFVKPGKCRLVIIDLYDKVFAQNPLESNSDLIQNLNSDFNALKMTMAADDVRAFNQFGVRLCLNNASPEYKADGILYNGFRSLESDFHYSDDQHIYIRKESHIKAFDEVLQYLQEIQVPCLLTCQPLPYRPVNHHQFIKDIQPLLDKYHLTLYDFTDMKNIVNPSGFADMSHLNARGAQRYSDFLLDSLVKDILEKSPVAVNN